MAVAVIKKLAPALCADRLEKSPYYEVLRTKASCLIVARSCRRSHDRRRFPKTRCGRLIHRMLIGLCGKSSKLILSLPKGEGMKTRLLFGLPKPMRCRIIGISRVLKLFGPAGCRPGSVSRVAASG